MNKEPYIAYVGHMLFPWGQAASRRVYGNAMSLVNSGRNVIVASGSDGPSSITCLEQHENGKKLSHIGLGISPSHANSPIKKTVQLLFSSTARTMQWLNSQPVKPSHVVLYGGYTPFLIRLLPWCHHKKIPLIADVVEWNDPGQLPGGVCGLTNMNYNVAMKYLYPKCDGIISISSYLTDYYQNRGCPVVQVPPTIDSSEMKPTKVDGAASGKLKLIYAGSPGKKDLLKPIIEGIHIADPREELIELTVLGPSAEEVADLCPSKLGDSNSIKVIGRVSQDEVATYLQSSEFSVLLRPNERYANAGFPTKFVESMSNGVPVIANCTSDIGSFLNDGVNGFICRDHSAEAFAHALLRAIVLNRDERYKMASAAYETARDSFDYRSYSSQMSSLFKEVL